MTAQIQWFSFADTSLCCNVVYCNKFAPCGVPGPSAELSVNHRASFLGFAQILCCIVA